ncbi:6-bladed beta-propeller [candidate division KSB1 bacterium]
MKRTAIFIALSITVTTFSFAQIKEKYKIEKTGNITYVHNFAPQDDRPSVSLEFDRQIGTLDGDDEHYLLHDVQDIEMDSEGNLYIVERGNKRVQKFSKDGEYLKTIGREGQGPGEYEHPVTIGFDSEGNIFIGDIVRKMHIFDSDGNFLKIRRLSYKLQEFGSYFVLPDGRIVGTVFHWNPSQVSFDYAIFGKDPDSEVITLGKPVLDTETQGRNNLGGLFNFGTCEIDNLGRILKNHYCLNRISIIDPNNGRQIIVDRALGFNVKNNENGLTQVSNGFIGSDSKNRIWVDVFVKRYISDMNTHKWNPNNDNWLEENVYQVFDSEGIWLCNLPKPENAQKRFLVSGDRLFGINDDCIYVYKIIEN